MRKLLSTIVAVMFSAGIAAAAFIPILAPSTPGGIACSEPSQSLYCYNQIISTINSYLGLVAAQPGPIASTATTNEQTFSSTVLPGGTLAVAGQELRIRCGGITTTNSDSKLARLYFGSVAIPTGQFNTSGAAWELELLVMAGSAGANSSVIGRGSLGSAVTVSPIAINDVTDNLAAAITVKCTGTQSTANAGEMTEEVFSVEQVK